MRELMYVQRSHPSEATTISSRCWQGHLPAELRVVATCHKHAVHRSNAAATAPVILQGVQGAPVLGTGSLLGQCLPQHPGHAPGSLLQGRPAAPLPGTQVPRLAFLGCTAGKAAAPVDGSQGGLPAHCAHSRWGLAHCAKKAYMGVDPVQLQLRQDMRDAAAAPAQVTCRPVVNTAGVP